MTTALYRFAARRREGIGWLFVRTVDDADVVLPPHFAATVGLVGDQRELECVMLVPVSARHGLVRDEG